FCRMTADQFSGAVAAGLVSQALVQRDVLQESHWRMVKPSVISGRLRMIVDIDDDLLNVPIDKDPLGSYADGRNRMEDILRSANAIFVSTDDLRKKYAELNANIHVLKNGLSRRLWRGSLPKGTSD